ncbi:MAG: 3-phosphoshikimate 1-carboxyvinyltransferase [Pyrinomonadaceae bacterium]
MRLSRATSIKGQIDLPGDKSVSHRAAMLAAIANGKTRISNFAPAADCEATLDCLNALGVCVTRDGETVNISGSGKYGLLQPSRKLDCGNSGTTMRLLAGILAGQEFTSTLVGDDSLESRPMKRIIDPLTEMGASIQSKDGRAPLSITGSKPLRAIDYNLPIASAQIKSCVLLAGLYARGESAVIEVAATRDHTERMLEWFGAEVRTDNLRSGRRITVAGESDLTARDLKVPADISSAAFFVAAAACLDGSDITLRDVGINPTRKAFLDVLCELGADIELSDEREASNEPTATMRVRGGLEQTNETLVIDGSNAAGLIDEIPVLAVLGTQLDGGLEVRGAAELRVKESDRIATLCENLRRMNAGLDEFEDGFRVFRSDLTGSQITTYGDHRIAMAFAVAALLAEGETEIKDADCVAISFPRFFETLKSVVT